MEANNDVAKTEKDSAAAPTEAAVDAKLGGLLNSLSGQVTTAFSQLGELHAELCAHRKATMERERELDRKNDQIQRESSELEQLRASVSRSGEELARREMEMRRYENEVSEKRENCSREIQRLDDLCRELDSRSSLLGAREKAIDGCYELLGRMRAVMVETSVPAIEAAVAEIAGARWQQSAPVSASPSYEPNAQGAESVARSESVACIEYAPVVESDSSLENDAWVESVLSMDDGSSIESDSSTECASSSEAESVERCERAEDRAKNSESDDRVEAPLPDLFSRELEPQVAAPALAVSPAPSESIAAPKTEEPSEQDAAPTIDLADFSEEELATFGVRRRLRVYSDAFLAAEIRAEREESKGKKKRWF